MASIILYVFRTKTTSGLVLEGGGLAGDRPPLVLQQATLGQSCRCGVHFSIVACLKRACTGAGARPLLLGMLQGFDRSTEARKAPAGSASWQCEQSFGPLAHVEVCRGRPAAEQAPSFGAVMPVVPV